MDRKTFINYAASMYEFFPRPLLCENIHSMRCEDLSKCWENAVKNLSVTHQLLLLLGDFGAGIMTAADRTAAIFHCLSQSKKEMSSL